MGSFSGTCGLTRLPLRWGEPVRAVLLAQAPRSARVARYCYPDDLWYPFSPVVRGKYDDAGGVEGIKSPGELHEKLFRERCADLFAKTPKERREWLTVPLDQLFDMAENYDLEDSVSHVEYDDPKTYQGGRIVRESVKVTVGLWMCHEGAYRRAMASAQGYREDGTPARPYFRAIATTAVRHTYHIADQARASFAIFKKAGLEKDRRAPSVEIAFDLSGESNEASKTRKTFLVMCRGASVQTHVAGNVIEMIEERLLKGGRSAPPYAEAAKVYRDVADQITLNAALSGLREHWHPMGNIGAQFGETFMHAALAEWTAAYAKRRP